MEKYLGLVNGRSYSEFLSLVDRLGYQDCLSISANLQKTLEQATTSSVDFESDVRVSGRRLRELYDASKAAFRLLNGKTHFLWTEEDIIEANYLITQGVNEKSYRTKKVFIDGSDVSCPSSERVPYHMQSFMRVLDEDINPLEKSIILHFLGVRIHPFLDGNGRTFRMVQNTLLYQKMISPFVITKDMRKAYFHLLENASVEWRDIFDSFPRYKRADYMFSKLYLTPRRNMQALANFIADAIIDKYKKACN